MIQNPKKRTGKYLNCIDVSVRTFFRFRTLLEARKTRTRVIVSQAAETCAGQALRGLPKHREPPRPRGAAAGREAVRERGV